MTGADMGIVAFTPGGRKLAERLAETLKEPLAQCQWRAQVFYQPKPLQEWCGKQWRSKQAFVFIGAAGIAVRAIAPWLESKATDPAVLVLDEKGQFVISLLSGHLGGGNELAIQIAGVFGATPVITTASDVNGKLAIDVFAKKNQLYLENMELAKKVAAVLVAGGQVGFVCEGRIEGEIPWELSGERNFWVHITPDSTPALPGELRLVPKAYVLGMGCRRGTSAGELRDFVQSHLDEAGISIYSLAGVATIDLKKQETGLLEFCESSHLPLIFYSPRELGEAPGNYPSSEFVQSVTGVDNVCERAAVLLARESNMEWSRQDCLVLEKQKGQGMTMALARRDWSVAFE